MQEEMMQDGGGGDVVVSSSQPCMGGAQSPWRAMQSSDLSSAGNSRCGKPILEQRKTSNYLLGMTLGWGWEAPH